MARHQLTQVAGGGARVAGGGVQGRQRRCRPPAFGQADDGRRAIQDGGLEVLGAAVDEIEHRARQAAARREAQFLDREGQHVQGSPLRKKRVAITWQRLISRCSSGP